MMKQLYSKIPALLLTLIVGLIATSTAFGTATIVIQNDDLPNVGFNDPTPATPVGGNSGTTVGQQRLIAFQAAADIWGATLTSGPTITIKASWASLTPCSASSGTLGSAGATSIFRNFTGAPFTNTWYSVSLANALSNSDGNGATAEISAQFNSNLGNTGCLQDLHWYYGLDTNAGADGIDLVTVLLHEFGHGLGFQTFTSSETGAQNSGFPSIYDRFLFDNSTGKTWLQMTDAERVTSAINTNNLVWNGPQVVSDVPSVLGTPRLRVNSPPAIAGNYQVGTADFGAKLTSSGVTAGVVQALDPVTGDGPATTDACSPLTNGGAVSGKIALIDRGTCTFVVKVRNAQDAGATGVIIADNVVGSPPPGLGGSDPTITIPAVRITLANGNTIKSQLASGVNATLLVDGSAPEGADASGRPRMYTPNPREQGSSVSHWDTSLFPNQLMEPDINPDLSHSVVPPQDLTFSLLRDIGWCSGCAQPPPPSPTPTPSPPPNDNFVNAQIISGCSGSVTGTNVGATHEQGEPSHDSATPPDPGASSVWYQWQAPGTGSVTITTAGSNYDTMLGVYTGSSVSTLTLIAKNDDVDPGVVRTSTVTFNATIGTVYKIAVDGWGGDTGNIVLNWTQSGCSAMIFSTAAYSVNESAGSVTLTVTRSGDTSGAASVDYRTIDDPAEVRCDDQVNNHGAAYARCDYATSNDTLSFAPGDASKSFVIPIINDGHVEGPETFQVVLSNPSTGLTLGTPATATVTINDNDTAGTPNPILASDDAGIAFFVRQHYLDFLAREPEVGEPWSAILRGCADQFNFDPTSPSAGCDRITVSGSFFGSPEFLNKGIYVIVFYRVAFNRLPQYVEFAPDLRSVTGPTQAETFAKRATFANNFVLRPEFVSLYAALSNQDYVNALMGRYSLSSITTPDPANPDGPAKVTLTSADLTNRLNGVGGTLTRAQVLRAIVQSDQVSGNLEAVNAFVASQYYGYLRRTPDTGGFNGWVTHLSQHPNDFRTMVNGFVNSIEYRLRFGP